MTTRVHIIFTKEIQPKANFNDGKAFKEIELVPDAVECTLYGLVLNFNGVVYTYPWHTIDRVKEY